MVSKATRVNIWVEVDGEGMGIGELLWRFGDWLEVGDFEF